MMFEHQSKQKKILLIIFGLFLLVGITSLIWMKKSSDSEQIFCTLEAKLCPDGSYVGRSGPKCEFTPCPDATNSIPAGTEDWTITSDILSGVTFRYPTALTTTYIRPIDWPPRIQVVAQPYSCSPTGSEISLGGQTIEKTISGQQYCVTTAAEGAAGSTYTQYTYTVGRGQQTIILTFSLKSVQCANYNDPEKSACDQERTTFSIDSTIDLMAQSIRVE